MRLYVGAKYERWWPPRRSMDTPGLFRTSRYKGCLISLMAIEDCGVCKGFNCGVFPNQGYGNSNLNYLWFTTVYRRSEGVNVRVRIQCK